MENQQSTSSALAETNLISDSLYAKYILERECAAIIEDEQSFITYKMNNGDCFILNMFIHEDFRSSGKCREIIDQISDIAKKAGCKTLTGTIDLHANGATRVQIAALGVGFKTVKAHNDILFIQKTLGGHNG